MSLELRRWVEGGADMNAPPSDICEAIRIKQMLDLIDEMHESISKISVLCPNDIISRSEYWVKVEKILGYITKGKLINASDAYIGRLRMYPHDIAKAVPMYTALRMAHVAERSGTLTVGDLTIRYTAGGPAYGEV